MKLELIKSLIKIAALMCFAEAHNILVYLPSSGRSHFKPFQPLFLELVHKGHNVTVMSNFPLPEKIANYTNILPGKSTLENIKFANLRKQHHFQNWLYMHDKVQQSLIEVSALKELQSLIQSKDSKFDLIFIELYHTDGLLSLGYRFNCPVIGLSFQNLLPQYHWITKNALTFSYIPHIYLPYTDIMNFWERFINSIFGTLTLLVYQFRSVPWHQKQVNAILQTVNVTNIPTFEDVRQHLSLILVESHFSAGYVQPNLPGIVNVAGIHLYGTSSKIPQDIQNFINDAQNGYLYVSLGTLIEPELAKELGLKLMKIFQRIPYRVIWKWTETATRNMSNIMIRQWLPQMALLNHPKCKLFISHGGYHSLLETIHSGMPILGLPFFTDQHYNTAIIEKFAIGKKISPEATETELEEMIIEVLTNEKYRQNAQHQSKLFKDRPMSPMDTAIYWVEYVIRYKGAPHLKSSATELYWFQYLLLDIISVVIIIFCGFIYLIKKFVTVFYIHLRRILTLAQKPKTEKFKKQN